MAAMTRSRLVRALAGGTGTNNRNAKAVLASLAIRETKKSGAFKPPGLGRRLKLVNRKSRVGYNPDTGSRILLAPTGRRTISKRQIRYALK